VFTISASEQAYPMSSHPRELILEKSGTAGFPTTIPEKKNNVHKEIVLEEPTQPFSSNV
jgi:hypothetical protein